MTDPNEREQPAVTGAARDEALHPEEASNAAPSDATDALPLVAAEPDAEAVAAELVPEPAPAFPSTPFAPDEVPGARPRREEPTAEAAGAATDVAGPPPTAVFSALPFRQDEDDLLAADHALVPTEQDEPYPPTGSNPAVEGDDEAPLPPVPAPGVGQESAASVAAATINGTAGPANPPTAATRAASTHRRARKARQRRNLVLMIGGAVVVIAAIVLALLWFLRPQDPETPDVVNTPATATATSAAPTEDTATPAAAANALGEALAKGDATAALALIDTTSVTPTTGVDLDLLTNDVYTQAKDRPEAITVDQASLATPASDAVEVSLDATVRQSGKDIKMTLALHRANASAPWKVLLESLPSLKIADASGAGITVNGQKITVPGTAGDYIDTRFFVLPGSYEIERKGTKYTEYPKAKTFTAAASTLSATAKGSDLNLGSVSLAGKRTTAFETEAKKAATTWLNKCAKSTNMAPKDCPFSAPTTYQGVKITDVQWTITTDPTLTIDDYGLGNEVLSGTGGAAKATGVAKVNGTDESVSAVVSSFGFEGSLQEKDGKIVFTYDG